MAVDLTKLFFWSSCFNFVGFPNIRGDELQTALNLSGGASGALILGPVFPVPDASPPVVVPMGPVFDDLGLFDPLIPNAFGPPAPGLRVPADLDPPIIYIQLSLKYAWAAALGSRTSGTIQDGGPVAAISDIVDVIPEAGSAAVGRTFTATSGPISVGQGTAITWQPIAAQVSGAPLSITLGFLSYTVLK